MSVVYKNSVRTAQYTLSTSVIKKINHLVLYKAKVAIVSEIHTQHVNTM